jgi:hypothetical protein
MNRMIRDHTVIVVLCVFSVLRVYSPCNAAFGSKKVHEVALTLPQLPNINVSDPTRFLNDLMLSPMWKIEQNRDETFVARARSINSDFPSDNTGRLLFEFMGEKDRRLPKDFQIRDAYLEGRRVFSSFAVEVIFRRPPSTEIIFGHSGQTVTLEVYESFEKNFGSNSVSSLAVKLSEQHEIYVVLREKGADPTRSTTLAKLPPVLRELVDLASSPSTYRVEERYAAFFQLFFQPPFKDSELKRFPGLQDRDTFYGYFRAKPGTSYNGINIKISHPVYCPGEGTRKFDRLRKAEYLGKPYAENDLLFFLIEDNAVYLSGIYDQQFGTFTGKSSFDGTLEILNDAGVVLLKTTDKFKGWQR